MLFNSYEFIFIFLPICLAVFFAVGKTHARVAVFILVVASLGFYAWWEVSYLSIILVSIIGNFLVGKLIANTLKTSKKKAKLILSFGVAVNLATLGYYKYANFAIEQANGLLGFDYHATEILLPLAISFFTFQQIAYLVDTYKTEIKEHSFLQYCLFVSFFPQLIAGPIVHHKEMLPQFAKPETFRINPHHIAIGLTLFSIGLFKKVVLADGIAVYASPLFAVVDHKGITLSGFEAWLGAIAYTLQLYFDFSGYSDMALGLARLFGIKLPNNFNSPYKATSIIEFWRRWHITLSRFLRDYLYIPLGGNRKGKYRRYINLFVTMLLGGLWHGAGWNFIIWGALHGSYLMINHMWSSFRICFSNINKTRLETSFYWLITMTAVIISWVYFRAETLEGANSILLSMSDVSTFFPLSSQHVHVTWALIWCLFLIPIAIFSPNSLEITELVEEHLSQEECQTKSSFILVIAVTSGLAGLIAIGKISPLSEFLYFNF